MYRAKETCIIRALYMSFVGSSPKWAGRAIAAGARRRTDLRFENPSRVCQQTAGGPHAHTVSQSHTFVLKFDIIGCRAEGMHLCTGVAGTRSHPPCAVRQHRSAMPTRLVSKRRLFRRRRRGLGRHSGVAGGADDGLS